MSRRVGEWESEYTGVIWHIYRAVKGAPEVGNHGLKVRPVRMVKDFFLDTELHRYRQKMEL